MSHSTYDEMHFSSISQFEFSFRGEFLFPVEREEVVRFFVGFISNRKISLTSVEEEEERTLLVYSDEDR